MCSEIKQKPDVNEPSAQTNRNNDFWVLKEAKTLAHKWSQQSQRPKLFKRLQYLNILFLPKAERFKTIPLCVNPTLRGAVIVVWLLAQGSLCREKQRKILQGRRKQSCWWGHGSDFSPHAVHTASSIFHWNGVDWNSATEWNRMGKNTMQVNGGMEWKQNWGNGIEFNWMERKRKECHGMEWNAMELKVKME